MFFLAVCFFIVATPYGVEFFYFKKRFGIFAAIFWLFVFQIGVLFGAEYILSRGLGGSLPDWTKLLVTSIGALAVLTICVAPFLAGFSALIFCGVEITAWFQKRKNRISG